MAKSMSQQLQEARALIAQGWCQGQMRTVHPDGSQSYCLVGAAFAATPNRIERWALYRLLAQHLPDGFGRFGDVACFNDSPSTTQADALAVFDRALTEVSK